MKEFTITAAEENQRLNKYLQRLLPAAGESFLYKMLRKKNILLNGEKASGREMVQAGDHVRIYFSDETFAKFATEKRPVRKAPPMPEIIFEDAEILIVDKAAGMLTQDDASDAGALTDVLRSRYAALIEETKFTPAPLNRLDRNTSGLVICAKTLHAAQAVSALIKERKIEKRYLALVAGSVPADTICEDFWKTGKRKVTIAGAEEGGFLPIATRYRLLESRGDLSLLEATLISGRKHQIRAQLSFHGAAILGDPLYGEAERNRQMKERYGLRRQLLHAASIRMPQTEGVLAPVSGKRFEAPLPDDFVQVLLGEGFSERGEE